jgi:hypothetical protein
VRSGPAPTLWLGTCQAWLMRPVIYGGKFGFGRRIHSSGSLPTRPASLVKLRHARLPGSVSRGLTGASPFRVGAPASSD